MADPYVYPDTSVLQNKAGIRDRAYLDRFERLAVVTRTATLKLTDAQLYDATAASRVHEHLFQDVYAWAGKHRTVDISKGNAFLPVSRIDMGLHAVATQLRQDAPPAELAKLQAALRAGDATAPREAAARLAGTVAELNYVHPFREGNGRTTRAYLDQLAQRAGLRLDRSRIDPAAWIRASIESSADPANTRRLREQIAGALVPLERARARTTERSAPRSRSADRGHERDDERGR